MTDKLAEAIYDTELMMEQCDFTPYGYELVGPVIEAAKKYQQIDGLLREMIDANEACLAEEDLDIGALLDGEFFQICCENLIKIYKIKEGE